MSRPKHLLGLRYLARQIECQTRLEKHLKPILRAPRKDWGELYEMFVAGVPVQKLAKAARAPYKIVLQHLGEMADAEMASMETSSSTGFLIQRKGPEQDLKRIGDGTSMRDRSAQSG